MGCLNSAPKENRGRFRVKNLDDQNRVVGEGELEVTATHLVLHQNDEPIKWPLKFLRRYGYDENLFSFEAGRRCPTGEGIYAFSTRGAEQIFRLVETNIKKRKSSDDDDGVGSGGGGGGGGEGADGVVSPALPDKTDSPDGIGPQAGKGPEESRGLSYAVLDLPTSKQWPIAQVEASSSDKNKKRSKYAVIDFKATEHQAAAKLVDGGVNYADMDFSNQDSAKTSSSKRPAAAEKTNYAEIIPKLRDDPISEPPMSQSSNPGLNYAEVTVGSSSSSKPVSTKPPPGSEYTQIDFKRTKALQQTAQGQGGEYVNTSSTRQTRHA
ncbi:uncharacterized protein [Oscarella lobularis]|uniref:uncharacterized protein n=1 Tax=Oscarella lobularis TaxID=121494 RepID=UPI003314217C